MKRSIALGACLLAFVTTFSTTRAAELPDMADLIIYNAKVLTVNSNFTVASAIAVKGDRILAVGKDRRLEEFRGPETRIVDAQGRTIMPGLYDSGVSSFVAAMSEIKKPWPVINSITNAQEYIRKQATNTAKGEWIELDFIAPTRLTEGRLPTKEELDAATTNVPVYWNFGTTTVVNSKALEVSKIDKDTQAPTGGEIVLDPKHHKPTGLLRNAMSVLKLPKADKPVTAAQERAALKHLYQLYNEQGITSIGEDAASTNAIDMFRDLSSSNELTVRINAARYFSPSKDADESIDRLAAFTNAPAGGKLAYGPTGVGDDWVKIGPLETSIDGNAGMGTAYLRTPYGIGPTYMISELAYRGLLMQDAFALPQVYTAAAQQGWQLETHAAGDAALDFVLNSYEQVQFKFDIKNKRFLIAHPEFQAAQDWSRCQKLGVGAVLEPTCLYEDGASLEKTLGTNRLTYYMPLKGWFDRGIVAGGASVHFVGLDSVKTPRPWNPWLGIWATLTRQTRDGGEINPQEKLTREQAVKLYTYNNAWLHGEEKQKGSLEPGKLADLIMVDMDIMKCPVDEIPNAKVLFTMVGGKVVWQAIEPIFPGPQVIPAMTINVTNAPANVATATPIVPSAVNNQSAAAAAKHAADASTGINPYAPVAATTPVPAAATEPVSATTTSNTTATVATTAQPAVSTNSATSTATTTTTATTTAPATQTGEAKPETTAATDSASGIAGAAPAEVAVNQAPTTTSTVTTNQTTGATATNAVPGATATNAANSVVAPAQVATAAGATTTDSSTVTTPAAQATPKQVAAATTTTTTAAPAAATPDSSASTTSSATTSTAPATSTTTTNDAAASQDWSRVGTGAK